MGNKKTERLCQESSEKPSSFGVTEAMEQLLEMIAEVETFVSPKVSVDAEVLCKWDMQKKAFVMWCNFELQLIPWIFNFFGLKELKADSQRSDKWGLFFAGCRESQMFAPFFTGRTFV